MPDPSFTGSQYVVMGPDSYGGINFWDTGTNSILGANYNFVASPIVYSDFSGEELTQNLTNYECLSAGRSSVSGTETDNVILQDKSTGARYIYLMSNSLKPFITLRQARLHVIYMLQRTTISMRLIMKLTNMRKLTFRHQVSDKVRTSLTWLTRILQAVAILISTI